MLLGMDFLVILRSNAIYSVRVYPSHVDAFFETVSGFTTTGSTILDCGRTCRTACSFGGALTHWVGGMGVLVFVMVVTSLDEKEFHASDACGSAGTREG